MTLLGFENARIDLGGAPAISGLTLEEAGPNVGLIGAWGAWFRLLGADATLQQGRATVLGARAEAAVRENVAGLGLCDPPLPLRQKALEYLEMSAALTGASGRRSRELGRDVLERLGLEAVGRRVIGTLSKVERRALVIAHALLGRPRVVCLETPLADLDAPSKAVATALIQRALESSSVIASVARPLDDAEERALLDGLGRVLVLEGGALLAQGTSAEVFRPARRYAVTVARSAQAFVAALRVAGAKVEPATVPQLTAAILAGGAAPERVFVEIPDGAGSGLIVDTALAEKAPIVELLPLELSPRS